MALAVKTKTPAITAEEMERRRLQVYKAFRSNAMEGLAPNEECQPAFDAYIAGDIDLDELGAMINQIVPTHQWMASP